MRYNPEKYLTVPFLSPKFRQIRRQMSTDSDGDSNDDGNAVDYWHRMSERASWNQRKHHWRYKELREASRQPGFARLRDVKYNLEMKTSKQKQTNHSFMEDLWSSCFSQVNFISSATFSVLITPCLTYRAQFGAAFKREDFPCPMHHVARKRMMPTKCERPVL